MKKTILILTGLIVLIFAVIGYRMYTRESPDEVNKSPEYIISADELLREFQKDNARASLKYIDKRILLTGTLKAIDTSGTLTLGTSGHKDEIIVGIHPRYQSALVKARTGSTVKVQGICSGFSQDSASGEDLLSGLGATIRFRSGGIKP